MSDSISLETRAGAAEAGQAQHVLDAFESVGAQRFDLTFTDLAGGRVSFRPDLSLDQRHPSRYALRTAGNAAAAIERRHGARRQL